MRHGRAARWPKASVRRAGPRTMSSAWPSRRCAARRELEQHRARVACPRACSRSRRGRARRPSAPPRARHRERDAAAERVARRVGARTGRRPSRNSATASASASTVGGPASGAESPKPGRSTATTSRSRRAGRAPAATSATASRCRGSGRAAARCRGGRGRATCCGSLGGALALYRSAYGVDKVEETTGGADMAAVEDQAVTTGSDRGRVALQELAKRHLWMHFTRMGGYDDHEIPIIVRGDGLLRLGRARQALPGRARRPVLREHRPRPRGRRPGRRRPGQGARLLHELELRAPEGDRARRARRRARPRRPQPRLLHLRRLARPSTRRSSSAASTTSSPATPAATR